MMLLYRNLVFNSNRASEVRTRIRRAVCGQDSLSTTTRYCALAACACTALAPPRAFSYLLHTTAQNTLEDAASEGGGGDRTRENPTGRQNTHRTRAAGTGRKPNAASLSLSEWCLSGGAAARTRSSRGRVRARAGICATVLCPASFCRCCFVLAAAAARSYLLSLSLDQDLSIVCNRRASAPARVRLS